MVVGGIRKAPSQAITGLALLVKKKSRLGQPSPCVLCSRLLPDRSHSIKQTLAKGNRGLDTERSGSGDGNMGPLDQM